MGSAWVISGEPGIGKSALLRELGALGTADDFEIRSVAITEPVAGGFAPWEQLFHERRDPGHAHTERAKGGAPDDGAQLSTELTLLRYVERLESAAAERPQLLLLDDFDRADPESIAAVELLARKAATLRVLIVAAIREPSTAATDPELARSAEPWHRPRAEGTLRSLPLGPLGEEACRRLVSYALGGRSAGPKEGERVARIVRAAHGIPFAALELARYANREAPPPEATDSGGLAMRALLRVRKRRFSPSLRRFVDAASVMGPTFELAPVGGASELTPRAVRAAIQELTGEGWIVPAEGGGEPRYRFSHELLWQALREEVPPKRVRSIAARLAQWWSIHRPTDQGGLGRWRGEAGQRREARRALRLAIRRCLLQGEYPVIATHLNRYREYSSGRPDEAEDAANLYLSVIAEMRFGRGQRYLPQLLADLVRIESPAWVRWAARLWEADLLMLQSPREARDRLGDIARYLEGPEREIPPELETRLILLRAIMSQFTAPSDVILSTCEVALRRLTGRGWTVERCRLRLAMAYAHHTLGHSAEARRIFDQAKRDARHAGRLAPTLDLIIEEVRVWGKESDGDLRGFLSGKEQLAERYGKAGLISMQATALVTLAGAEADLGDLEGAWRHASEARQLADRVGYRFTEAVSSMVLGQVLLDGGWTEEAERRLQEARKIHLQIGSVNSPLQWLNLAILVRCWTKQRRFDEANEGLAELESRISEPLLYYRPQLDIVRAAVVEATGDVEGAHHLARKAWAAAPVSQPRLRIEIAAFLARFDALHGRPSLAKFRTCELRSICAAHGVDPVPLLRLIDRAVAHGRSVAPPGTLMTDVSATA